MRLPLTLSRGRSLEHHIVDALKILRAKREVGAYGGSVFGSRLFQQLGQLLLWNAQLGQSGGHPDPGQPFAETPRALEGDAQRIGWIVFHAEYIYREVDELRVVAALRDIFQPCLLYTSHGRKLRQPVLHHDHSRHGAG